MKKIIILGICLASNYIGLAQKASLPKQIENPLFFTKWTGIANVPNPTEVSFEYKADTLAMRIRDEVAELMRYSTKGDTLTITKIYGGSPCSNDAVGVYKYEIKNNSLVVKVISEECLDRAEVFGENVFKRE